MAEWLAQSTLKSTECCVSLFWPELNLPSISEILSFTEEEEKKKKKKEKGEKKKKKKVGRKKKKKRKKTFVYFSCFSQQKKTPTIRCNNEFLILQSKKTAKKQ